MKKPRHCDGLIVLPEDGWHNISALLSLEVLYYFQPLCNGIRLPDMVSLNARRIRSLSPLQD